MYGFGEYVEDNYSTSFFITEPSDYFIQNNFSSIWKDSNTILNVQYNFRMSDLEDESLSSSYLSSISYTFPFTKSGHYCTIGFNPYTMSTGILYNDKYKYLTVNEISTLDESLAYNVIYSNNGGISKSYINFSSKIFDRFYLGIKYSFLFGNLEQKKRIRLYDLEYILNDEMEEVYTQTLADSISINRVNEYKGTNIAIESKYRTDNIDFILSGTYNFPLEVSSNYFFGNNIESLELVQAYLQPNQNIMHKNKSMLKNFSLGLKYKLDDSQTLSVKLMKQNAFEYNVDSMYLPDPEIYSINLWYNLISKIFNESRLNYINYRIGFFSKHMKFSDISDYDYGVTFDFTLRLSDMNSYSLFFKIGKKTYSHIDLNNEQYCLIGLRFESIEKWFLKGVEK